MHKTARKEIKILLIAILLYIIIIGGISVMRHYQFQTQTNDMGIFVQNMWNTSRGRIMQNTLEELPNHFAIHWSPFLLLLAPLYRIIESPYTLLIIQTTAIAIGAWPLYLLANKVLQSSRWSLFIAAAYLLYPPLQWVNTYDFHEIAFLPTFLLSAIYFLSNGRTKLSALFFILAASTKEDAILIVAFVGMWLIIESFSEKVGGFRAYYYKKNGAVIVFLSLLYFIIAIKVFMPTFGGGLLRLDRYANLGGSFGEISKNLLTHPGLFLTTIITTQKLIYLFGIFAPIAFVPFFAPSTLVLLIPGLLENLLTTYQFQFQGLYQYDAAIIGGVFIGVIYGFRNVLKWYPQKKKVIFRFFFIAIIISYLFRSPMSFRAFPIELFRANSHWETLRAIVRNVPPNASVSANTNLVPHLAHREKIYMLGHEPEPVDIVLIDGTDLFGFKNEEEFQTYADSYALSGNYEIQSIGDRYFIFTKKK